LISAELAIQQLSEKHPEDARTMALEGRAELLEHDYDRAIQNLTRAEELAPGNPDILVDLGCALALRGDAEKRTIDYGHALDVLAGAVKHNPRDERALFNIAIVYERLWLVEDALNAWRRLLAQRPPGGWAAEAQKHIDVLDKVLEQKKKAEYQIRKNPIDFLAIAKSVADPEVYQDTFWRDWLPRARTDGQAHAATVVLARQFSIQFGDRSLLDTISVPGDVAQTEAVIALAKVLALNQAGNNDLALQAAQDATSKLQSVHLPAAAMRAKLELAYSYNRAAKREECLAVSGEILSGARQRRYVWLEEMAHLVHASCAEGLGRSGPARVEFGRTYDAFEHDGFKVQSLLALGLLAAIDRASGNYFPVWENDGEGLRRYWETNAFPIRAQQFEYDMHKSAAALGWDQCAVVLLRAAARSAAEGNNVSIEMIDRAELAVLLAKTGDFASESLELNRASKTARSLPAGPTRDDLEWNLELDKADADIASKRPAEALGRLRRLEESASARRIREQIHLEETRGRALWAQNDGREATRAFERAIECNRRRIASVRAYTDRLAEIEMARASYRTLTEIRSGERSEARAALRLWHEYRDRPEGEDTTVSATITYAVLPKGITVWLTDGYRTHMRRVDAPVEKVEVAARRFVRLCASPSSSEAEIRKVGHELFGWLIAPELKEVRVRSVKLEPDEWISSIPFGALNDDTGKYLAQTWVLADAADFEEKITRNSSVLIVAAPFARAPGQGPLPVLTSAAAESKDVASRFVRPVVFLGAASTDKTLAALMAKTELFHFSGHGWSDGGNGALLLPSPTNEESQFVTSRSLARQDWSHCSLAVLSACLTGSGEQEGPVNNESLVRALLSAGARRVIATRWNIDSEASRELMRRFYDGLFAERRAAQALVHAEMGVAGCRGWSHPYYWAGIEIFGRF
jgi:CHAT domain-containing protein